MDNLVIFEILVKFTNSVHVCCITQLYVLFACKARHGVGVAVGQDTLNDGRQMVVTPSLDASQHLIQARMCESLGKSYTGSTDAVS